MDHTQIRKLLKEQGRVIRIGEFDRVVFVGDTHGDIDATQRVLDNYLNEQTCIVFLGDYVDRGPHSRENADLLLETKLAYPENLYLLCGNHETYRVLPFWPADFWLSLTPEELDVYSETFSLLPFCLVSDGILALHGAPPDTDSIDQINNIQENSSIWRAILWGDLYDRPGDILDSLGARVAFGRDYFFRVKEKLGFNLLIRGHQRDIDVVSFNGCCVTLLSSYAYAPVRLIAIVRKGAKSAKDVEVVPV